MEQAFAHVKREVSLTRIHLCSVCHWEESGDGSSGDEIAALRSQ